MRCNLRDWVIFFAGAQFFHMLGHIMMPYFMTFPIDMKVMVLTTGMNMYAIVINGVIMILLLWWAARLNRNNASKR